MTDKERLENMSPIGFDLGGNVLLKSEDYHWLMEQAERVEELEKINYDLKSLYIHLEKTTERYKQALEEIIRQHELEDEIDDYDFMWNVKQIARQALESDEN